MKGIRTSCCILLFCLGFTKAFAQKKHVPDFNKIKNSIHSIAFYNTQSRIEAVGPLTINPDSLLERKLSARINTNITKILKSNYCINYTPFIIGPFHEKEVAAFLNKLDSAQKILPEIKVPEFLKPVYHSNVDRYILVVFHSGFYLTAFEPHYQFKRNTLLANPRVFNGSSVQLLLADTHANRILYYNRTHSYNIDPRVPTEIDASVSKLVRPIYYK